MKKWPKKMMFCRQDETGEQEPEYHSNRQNYGVQCGNNILGKCSYDNRPCIVHEYVKMKK